MTSNAAAESPLEGVRGLVFFSFPLHQPGKPDTKWRRAPGRGGPSRCSFSAARATSWRPRPFWNPYARSSASAQRFTGLDTADHGFRTLKRSRKSDEDVFAEMVHRPGLGLKARVIRAISCRLDAASNPHLGRTKSCGADDPLPATPLKVPPAQGEPRPR